jgi:putative Holliday junction resolvase
MTSNQQPLKRILALDLGQARTGVAVSDLLGWTAQPVGIIKTCPHQKAIARIRDMVREYEVGTIVLGMPYNMNGTEGPQAVWVRQFGERLSRAIKGPAIVYWDERLTTFESEELLIESGMKSRKRKQHRDKIAAALILRAYLEHLRSRASDRPIPDTPPTL